ncbi:MAG TPA: hypothetical protein VGQ84_03630 [Gaiellaceae bacterium]|jgi:hypothetical protein|nr:hypothetical protein [Gaiellaceae bacterium]
MSETVQLRPEEREVAIAEAQAVFAVAAEPGYRDELAHLIAAADEGELESADAQTLERLVELGLQAGRIRALYGPGGEQAALRLYRRLPRGAELGQSAAAVTNALETLRGRTLESIRVDAVGPGAFALTIVVDGVELSIRLDRQGARVGALGT